MEGESCLNLDIIEIIYLQVAGFDNVIKFNSVNKALAFAKSFKKDASVEVYLIDKCGNKPINAINSWTNICYRSREDYDLRNEDIISRCKKVMSKIEKLAELKIRVNY